MKAGFEAERTLDPALDEYASDIAEGYDDRNVVGGMKKYRRLIKNIREYLKTKLPSHSIPSRRCTPSYITAGN